MSHEGRVSTGRGGQGNIGHDATVYTDGSIVREGPLDRSGNPNNPELSTGRGGAGNIGIGSGTNSRNTSKTRNGASPAAPKVKSPLPRTDDEVVPEPAMMASHQENFHTGRGGQGNIYKEKYGGHSTAKEEAAANKRDAAVLGGKQRTQSFGDKVKAIFKKDEPPSQ